MQNPPNLPNNPLTADDIAFIEECMDILLRDLFTDKEVLAQELQAPLTEKIKGYIAIADRAETDPILASDPELGQYLRKLLEMVNDYFHRLN